MAFSIRLTEEEDKLATAYAEFKNTSKGELFKKAFFQNIEDEYDVLVADKVFEAEVKDKDLSSQKDIIEFWQEMGL